MSRPRIKHVLFVLPFGIVPGTAGFSRVIGVARSAELSGLHVKVAWIDGAERQGRVNERHGDIELVQVSCEKSSRIVPRFIHRALLPNLDPLARWIESMPKQPDLVIVYGGNWGVSRWVLAWCRLHGILAAVDVVEWYDSRQFTGRLLSPYFISATAAFHLLYRRFAGVLTISRLLERRFSRLIPTLLVRPTLEPVVNSTSPPSKVTGLARCVYAGSAGRKDAIGTVVRAATSANAADIRVELDIYGLTQHELGLLVDQASVGAAAGWLRCHGRVSKARVMNALAEADYTVLVRPRERYAEAGFPTKFAESMVCGVPVIANLTSDMGEYLQEGVTGHIAASDSLDAVADALRRAARCSGDIHQAMRKRCLDRARESFVPAAYADALVMWLGQIASSARSKSVRRR